MFPRVRRLCMAAHVTPPVSDSSLPQESRKAFEGLVTSVEALRYE